MTTASDLAVVATRLAETDRRALSQAWYSALHLAHDEAPTARSARGAAAPLGTCASVATRASATAPVIPRSAPRTRAPGDSSPPRVAVERRARASELAERMERAVARLARTPCAHAAHTVALAGGRVTLLARSDAGVTRIIALCAQPLRAAVECALARARFIVAAERIAR